MGSEEEVCPCNEMHPCDITSLNRAFLQRLTSGWAAEAMHGAFGFHILGVGRLSKDQFIYVETRKNMFLILWDL